MYQASYKKGVNMEKTIVEKIMAKAVGKPEVSPGEYVKFGIKDTFIQVGSDIGALSPNEFKRLGWDKLFDPKKVIIAGTLRFVVTTTG
jgi:3-isopropylmalate/(R)-2-methylmalate dehydratase large subunit